MTAGVLAPARSYGGQASYALEAPSASGGQGFGMLRDLLPSGAGERRQREAQAQLAVVEGAAVQDRFGLY